MRLALLIVALFALLAPSLAMAASGGFITNYSEFSLWLPVIALAATMSVMFTGIYYIMGVVLQSKDIKSRAIGEFGQAVGTVIIVVALIGILWFVGTSEFSLVSALAPGSLSTVCSQLGASQVLLLNSNAQINDISTPTSVVCSAVSSLASAGGGAAPASGSSSGGTDITPQLDYGLLASYVIMANVTNQAATNINSVYIFEGWMLFLGGVTANSAFCEPLTCAAPDTPEAIEVDLFSTPMAGYGNLLNIFNPLETESWLTFYIMFVQLLVIILLILAWPYLLAAGMILRATFLTRRAGGLIMAIAVSMALIYPLMYVLEYSAFANLNLSPLGAGMTASGATANPLLDMPLYESQPNAGLLSGSSIVTYGSSGLNFFILPNAKEVIDRYSCMPPTDPTGVPNLLGGETAAALLYLAPGLSFASTLTAAISGFGGGLGVVPSISALGCSPNNAINAALALINLYGVVFVLGIVLPVINVMIAIAMVQSTARLFGGDTNILGIGKLI